MKKKGFTLMEVMLSVILFSLMVGGILGAYTKIQSTNLKLANTQEAIQAAEDFIERINDTSLEYKIDTGEYNDLDIANPNSSGQRKIFQSDTLHLTDKNNNKIRFYRECNASGYCTIKMNDIDLINNDKVTVNNLAFEIYPEQQYVNINITTKNLQGESIYKSGITLSTSVGYKTYEIYGGALTPETLCEDVCSLNEVQSNNTIQTSYVNMMKSFDNVTMNSCTLGYGAGYSENLWSYIALFINHIFGNDPIKTVYTAAWECAKGQNSEWCKVRCKKTSIGNPYNCGYIRNEIEKGNSGGFTGNMNDCTGYNDYVKTEACQNMCLSSIFTCLDDDGEENTLVKRTGIKVTSGEYAGTYLQNPKSYKVTDQGNYNNGTWTLYNGWAGCSNIDPVSNCDSLSSAFLRWICEALGGEVNSYECKNGYFYCDGEYYGGGLSTGITWMTKDEYENKCLKRVLQSQSPAEFDETRVVYTPEVDPQNTLGDCKCEVNYTYSLFAGGFIEDGTLVGMQHSEGLTGAEYTESTSIYEYRPKKANLIYVDKYDTSSNWPLNDVKQRIGVQTELTNYCNNNGLCYEDKYHNGKYYSHADTGGFYQLDDTINYHDLKCNNNSEFMACLNNGCCPASGTIITTYTTPASGINYNTALGRYCTGYLTGIDGSYGIMSGGSCRTVYQTGCNLRKSGYALTNINTSLAIKNYCTVVEGGQRDNANNNCKKYSGIGCKGREAINLPELSIKEYFCQESGYIRSGSQCLKTGSNNISNNSYNIMTQNPGRTFDEIKVENQATNSCFRIMDRNLGATQVGNNWKKHNNEAGGYYYQYGNNYGFTLNYAQSNYTNIIPDTSLVSNSNYVNKTWVKNNGRTSNLNIWGGGSDSVSNEFMPIVTNFEERQGPCPDGWHVPSAGERGKAFYYRGSKNGYSITQSQNAYYTSTSYLTTEKAFIEFLKIDPAGEISNINDKISLYNNNTRAILWTSSPYSDNERLLEMRLYTNGSSAGGIYDNNKGQPGLGLPIRCFKNTYRCDGYVEPTITYDEVNIEITDSMKQYYCETGLNNVRTGGQCKICNTTGETYSTVTIDTGNALKNYCQTHITGLNNTRGLRSGDSCYKYTGDYCALIKRDREPRSIDTTVALQYYCKDVLNNYWDEIGNTCYLSNIQEQICRWNGDANACPNDGNWRRLNGGNGLCILDTYSSCVSYGKGKNIYKDYTYTCDMSITQQSNSILNIIESLSNLSQTLTGNIRSGLPRYIRRAFNF